MGLLPSCLLSEMDFISFNKQFLSCCVFTPDSSWLRWPRSSYRSLPKQTANVGETDVEKGEWFWGHHYLEQRSREALEISYSAVYVDFSAVLCFCFLIGACHTDGAAVGCLPQVSLPACLS